MAGFTPGWAMHAVWYQILPERFASGNARNDPSAQSLQGAVHAGALPAGWRAHPWTSDWYALQPWEAASGKPLWASLVDRRYGGDLAGILQRLPYLQDLGVNAIYLNPVFDAPSHHKYDASTLHHVDVHLGPDPEGDRALIAREVGDDPATWAWTAADRQLLELIAAVHVRGMHIILDGVFNHVGRRHWAFRDLVEKQRTSRFADWFKVTSFADEPAGFQYESWRGHASLPEFRQAGDDLAPGPRVYVEAITRRWMAPDGDASRGIDGWRLDVAPWLPHGFWKHWRRTVKAIDPQAYLVAENIRDVAFNVPYLQGDEFDAVMNYNFAFACDEFFFRDRTRITARRFDALLRELREAYPDCVAPVMQNLFGSHDTARLASHALNRDRLDFRGFDETYHPRDSRAPHFDTRRPDEHARALQRLFVLFQMTYLGAPMVYYGDEAGLWGANDPCCRKPMLWPELQYEPEAADPAGGLRPLPQPVAFDAALFAHYRRCIGLRHALPVLRSGSVQTLLADDARQVLVQLRRDGAALAIVAINRSEHRQVVSVPDLGHRHWQRRFGGATLRHPRPGQIVLALEPLSGAVLAPGRDGGRASAKAATAATPSAASPSSSSR
jgi:cyclomaltodextrinase / maltogenic alpha-amylase / neopullulanase